MPLSQPVNADLKKLKKLSDQLDTAKDASEATTKNVRRARRTAESVKRAVLHTDLTKRRTKRSKDRDPGDGKNKAAVELGRKGGTARAKTLTRRQRSVLAIKAAKARWTKH